MNSPTNCPPSGEELEKLFSEAPTAELPVDLLGREPLSVLELAVMAKAVDSQCKSVHTGLRLVYAWLRIYNFTLCTL